MQKTAPPYPLIVIQNAARSNSAAFDNLGTIVYKAVWHIDNCQINFIGGFVNLLLLFVLGSLWGSSFLFIKVTVAEVPALTLVAGRLSIATAILLAILFLRRISLPRDRKLWGTYAVLGFFNAALPYSFITWGEQYITSGLAALLQASLPIFTVIFAQFLTEDEKINWTNGAGVLLGFIGVGVLMLPDLQKGLNANLIGMLAVIGACVSYALATIYARQNLQKQLPLVSAIGQLGMGAVFMLPLSLLVDRPFAISPSLPALASWFSLAILGTVLAYLLYFTLLKRASATFTTMVTYIVPINGLILGALVLNETLSANMLVSLALILTGVLLVRSS